MHPQIRQDHPGKCPICGMELTPITPSPTTASTEYTCSMHPKIRQDKPGKCPICGMELVPVTHLSAPTSTEATPSTSSKEIHVDNPRLSREKAGPRLLQKSVPLFGEIHYILDQHTHKTWLYGGRIERVLISYNTTEVEAGQPILELYSDEAIADQERYLTTLKERYSTTFYERKVASAQVEAAKSRLLQAGFTEEELRQLVEKKNVKRIFTIRAPHRGTIIGHLPEIGSRITPETTLFHIVPLDRVWFNAHVFEQDLANVRLGQEALIEIKTFPGIPFRGKLVFIDRMIDTASRSAVVRVELENPDKKLIPEMSGSGVIKIPLPETPVAIPSSAILDTGKRKIVYVETTSNHFEPRLIEAGVSDGSFVQILSGIKAGETVVTEGAFLIDAEAQLRGVIP